MRCYIATKWENGPRAQYLSWIMEAHGHTITWKWWEEEDFNLGVAAENSSPDDREKAVGAATQDIIGVQRADCVIAIMEHDFNYRGTWVEMGGALALGKPVLVLGNFHLKAVFGFHPLVKQTTWKDVVGDFEVAANQHTVGLQQELAGADVSIHLGATP